MASLSPKIEACIRQAVSEISPAADNTDKKPDVDEVISTLAKHGIFKFTSPENTVIDFSDKGVATIKTPGSTVEIDADKVKEVVENHLTAKQDEAFDDYIGDAATTKAPEQKGGEYDSGIASGVSDGRPVDERPEPSDMELGRRELLSRIKTALMAGDADGEATLKIVAMILPEGLEIESIDIEKPSDTVRVCQLTFPSKIEVTVEKVDNDIGFKKAAGKKVTINKTVAITIDYEDMGSIKFDIGNIVINPGTLIPNINVTGFKLSRNHLGKVFVTISGSTKFGSKAVTWPAEKFLATFEHLSPPKPIK